MPVEEEAVEQGEDQSHEAEAEQPDLVDERPDEAEQAEYDSECQGCVESGILPDPGQPTQKQLEDHRVDHLPFRSWCPECVAGRATGEQHIARKDPTQIATFSVDYLYCTKSRVVSKEAPTEGEEV